MDTPAVAPEVEAVEIRAKQAGVRMNRVLRRANINASTWWRWKQGGTRPILDNMRQVEAALEAELAERAA